MNSPSPDDCYAYSFLHQGEKRLLPRLHRWLSTPPDRLNPRYADFYALSNYVHAMGLVAHILFLTLFVLLKIDLLAWFNVLSIIAFAGSLYWSKNGLLDHALLLGGLEVAAHQGLAVACLGLDPGFQQYVLILVVGTLFFSHIPLRLRVAMAILPVIWYIALLIYGLQVQPWLILDDKLRIAFAAGNALMFIAMLMGMAIYFQYTVAKARTHAEKMAASKALFLANMSHELRTPLNAILGFSQILNRSQNLCEQDKANLATINRSGEHLLNLINRILDMSKMEEGKLELQPAPFLVDTLLDELREMFSLVAANKGLQLSVTRAPEIPHVLSGDELRLRQVLINLLNNALKFTEHGGIRVKLALSRPIIDQRAGVIFIVEDDGIGIAEAERGELFQLFSQTESGRQSRHGTGLGLALCRRFVELMGGQIQVDSVPGVGSRFSFAVDLAIPANLPSPDVTLDCDTQFRLAAKYDQALLVVDDNAENRDVLQQLLQGWGFEVATANDGAEAIAQWQSLLPGLIWMDLRMPVMDGFVATREILRLAAEQALPPPRIVAITASSMEAGKSNMEKMGFAGYVGKPFREIDVRRELESLLGVRFVAPKTAGTKPIPVALDEPADCARDLASLPEQLRRNLSDACELADFSAAEAAIAALSPMIPETAAQLSRWLADYRFDRLLERLENAELIAGSSGGQQ